MLHELVEYHTGVERNVRVRIAAQSKQHNHGVRGDVLHGGQARPDVALQQSRKDLDDVLACLELEPRQVHEQVLDKVHLVYVLSELCDLLRHGVLPALAVQDVLRLLDAREELLALLAPHFAAGRVAEHERVGCGLNDAKTCHGIAHSAHEVVRRALLRLEQEVHRGGRTALASTCAR